MKKEAVIVEEAPTIWKPIRGYEGLYEVNNHGEICSVKRTLEYEQKYNGSTVKVVSEIPRSYYPWTRSIKNIERPGIVLTNSRGESAEHFICNIVADAFLISDRNTASDKVKYKNGKVFDNRPENLKIESTVVIIGGSRKSKTQKPKPTSKPTVSSKPKANFNTLRKAIQADKEQREATKASTKRPRIKDLKTNKIYKNMAEAERALGLKAGTISRSIRLNLEIPKHKFICI